MYIFEQRLSLRFRQYWPLVFIALYAVSPLAVAADAEPSLPKSDQTLGLPEIEVVEKKPRAIPLSATELEAESLRSHAMEMDTSRMLEEVPGLSVYSAGTISGLPAIHGLADERLRTQVDGMDLSSACPNHMNSILSYIHPSRVGKIKVFSGVVPVSEGGDSLGGTIQVSAASPVFATGEQPLVTGNLGSFYRSNGYAHGWNAAAGFASRQFNLQYSESRLDASNYRAAKDFKDLSRWPSADWIKATDLDVVASSAISGAINRALDLAFKQDSHLLQLGISQQTVGFEGFPNQRMDMTDNQNTNINFRYNGEFDWGDIQARLYRQRVKHAMDIGAERADQLMPMLSKATTVGGGLKLSIPFLTDHIFKLGSEFVSYRLDDWWPPVGSAVGSMCCNDFQNIRNGRRDRIGLFAEMDSHWGTAWQTSLGLRSDIVSTDAADVQGYSNTASYRNDVRSFNALSHDRRDHNWDWTALARYMPTQQATYELGLARKSRSPNLYERYPWATFSMAALMNNFVGDGNGYVGDVNLQPEVAHTLNLAMDWHDEAQSVWAAKINAYLTYISDYVDAKRCNSGRCSPANRTNNNAYVILQYANQSARLHGLDFSAYRVLNPEQKSWGEFRAKSLISYTRGENTTSGNDLYHIMPLNGRFSLEHAVGGWLSTAELQLVSAKTHVSAVRNETQTDGYGLLNLRTSYSRKHFRVDFAVENALNKLYYSPLGGAYLGQGDPMSLGTIPWGINLPGMGRSVNVAFNLFY